jgi:hypothetical protein
MGGKENWHAEEKRKFGEEVDIKKYFTTSHELYFRS